MTAWQIAIIGSMAFACLWLGSTERSGRLSACLQRRAARRDPSWSARMTQMETLVGARPRR